jgi:hypothetical protein
VTLVVGFAILAVGTTGVALEMSQLGGNGYPRSQLVVQNLLQVLAFVAMAAGWRWLSSGHFRVDSPDASAAVARGALWLSMASLLFAGSYGMQIAIEFRAYHFLPNPDYHRLVGSILIQTAGAVVVAIGFFAMFVAHGRRDQSPSAVEQVAQAPNQVR